MAAPVSVTTNAADAANMRADRGVAMRRAYLSYSGMPKKPLFVRVGEPDDNLILSLGRLIVDKGASFLFGQEVESQVSDTLGASTVTAKSNATAKTAPRQDWLDECWRRNKRALFLQKYATNGGIFGHAFARIIDTKPWPRLIVLDPQTVDVLTDPDDIDTVWRYVIEPPPIVVDDDGETRKTRTIIQAEAADGKIAFLNRPPVWIITDQVFAGGGWSTTATRRWDYEFSPIVECQNLPKANDYWGESDLPTDLLQVMDALNRVASHYNKIIRLHAHPKLWTRGMGARTLDVGIDSVIHLPSDVAELRALEMKSDLASTMALLNQLLNLISMMARIPLVAMGMPDNLGAISGVALQIRYQPLVEKTTAKRRTYGDALQEMDRRLLALGGFGSTTLTQLHWHEMLPVDPLMERQVLVLDDALGVASKRSIAEKLGYDYDAESEQLDAEAQDAQARAPQLAPAGAPVSGSTGTGYPPVPPPAAIPAPVPDVAKKGTSR